MQTRILGISIVCAALAFTGCGNWTRTQKGGAGGAAAGGVIGGIIGHQVGHTAAGVLIGAAIGGTAGAAIGRYMDRDAEEIKTALPDAKVHRVSEGIAVEQPADGLFEENSANLTASGKQQLSQFAATLNKYANTNVVVTGHTDSTGSPAEEKRLSQEQAKTVADYLASQNVDRSRISASGHGSSSPIASNATPLERGQNRRIEFGLYANGQLKQQAQAGNVVVPQ